MFNNSVLHWLSCIVLKKATTTKLKQILEQNNQLILDQGWAFSNVVDGEVWLMSCSVVVPQLCDSFPRNTQLAWTLLSFWSRKKIFEFLLVFSGPFLFQLPLTLLLFLPQDLFTAFMVVAYNWWCYIVKQQKHGIALLTALKALAKWRPTNPFGEILNIHRVFSWNVQWAKLLLPDHSDLKC